MLFDVRRTDLATGVRVVSATIPRVESIAVGVWIGAGSRYETKKVCGVSHFIEHLLFKGTQKLSSQDITRTIEGCGGYCNGFTHNEMTCYYVCVGYNHLAKVLGILTDMILHPRFDPADIEKERGVIIEEIMMYRDQPAHLVQEMLDGLMWKNHPLGRPVAGSPDSLHAITRNDIARFKREKYVPQNIVFSFAGKLEHDRAVAQVKKLIKELRYSRKPHFKPITSDVLQDSISLRTKDTEQTHLALGFRTFGRHDKRKYSLQLLNVILGGNMSSRLFQVVREKHGLAYSVSSAVTLFADTGGLIVSAGLEQARYSKGLELIIREICRLKDKPVSSRELSRAKEFMIGHLRLALESPSGQMMWLGEHMLNYGAPIPVEKTIAGLKSVRSDDIHKLSNELFQEDAGSLALVSKHIDENDAEQVKSVLTCLS